MPRASGEWVRRWAPEIALAALAAATFLGFMGSVELWGKREQRAVAEAIDTIDNGHWLVARIQGRPRLEKPPLPRWTTAALMIATGRRDEAIARMPSALAAMGMVWLVYALGTRISSRSVGLASGLILTSSVFFVSELRQAGNDGPLAFFTALALYAALAPVARKRPPAQASSPSRPSGISIVGDRHARGAGARLSHQGADHRDVGRAHGRPLPHARPSRLKAGCRALFDLRGLGIFVVLALCWPVPVVLNDPKAIWVWYLEMAQKAGRRGSACRTSTARRAGRRMARPRCRLGRSSRSPPWPCRSGSGEKPRDPWSGSPGGGRSATSRCSASGPWPSPTITSLACPARRSSRPWPGFASPTPREKLERTPREPDACCKCTGSDSSASRSPPPSS